MTMNRRERLAGILARENDKSNLSNKVVMEAGLGTPKLRDLKLSAIDGATGKFQMPKSKKSGSGSRSEFSELDLAKMGGTMGGTVPSQPHTSQRSLPPHLREVHSSHSHQSQNQSHSHRSGRFSQQQQHDPGPLEPPSPRGPHKPKGEWTLLRQFEVELSTADQVMRKKLQDKEIHEHRAFLDQQRAEKDQMMEMARMQAQKEADKQKSDLRKWNMEEVAKRKVRALVEEKNKKEQDRQLVMIRAQREEEIERIRVQEDEAVQLAKRQLELEKDLDRRRKAEHAAKMKEDLQVMEDMIKEKEAKKQEAISNDRRMMESYQRLLEEQEKARSQATAAMYTKAMERSALAGQGVVQDRKNRMDKEAAIFKAQVDNAERAADRDEQNREARRVRLNTEQMTSLQRMAEEKLRARDRQKQEKVEFAILMREKDEADREATRQVYEAKRNRNVHHKMELIQQMHEDRMKDKPEEMMTPQEILLNAPLISRAREVLIG